MTERLDDDLRPPIAYGNLSIDIVVGQAWRVAATAIVCPDDVYLGATGDIAASIRKAAASADVDRKAAELAGWPDPVPRLSPGDAVPTPAGALPARFIIHAVALDAWGRVEVPPYLMAIDRALALCDTMRLDSLTIPAPGSESDTGFDEWARGLGLVLVRAGGERPSLRRVIIALSYPEDAEAVRERLSEELTRAEQRKVRMVGCLRVVSACLSEADAGLVNAAAADQASHEEVFQALGAIVRWVAEVVEAELYLQGSPSRIPKNLSSTEGLVHWGTAHAASIRAPVVREIVPQIGREETGLGAWLQAVPAIESALVREGTEGAGTVALTRGKEALWEGMETLASVEGFRREGSPTPVLRHVDGRELELRPPVIAEPPPLIDNDTQPPPTPRLESATERPPPSASPSSVPTDAPTATSDERTGPFVQIPRAPTLPTAMEPPTEPPQRRQSAGCIVDGLFDLLKKYLKGQDLAALKEVCRSRGFGGDDAAIRHLCWTTDPEWLLRQHVPRSALTRALRDRRTPPRNLEGKSIEDLAVLLLANLDFPPPHRPDGLSTFSLELEEHERCLSTAQDLPAMVGSVMGAARTLDRICSDLLSFHATLLFTGRWREELRERKLVDPQCRIDKMTLGAQIGCLQRIDAYLASGSAPDFVVMKWKSYLSHRTILGKLGGKLQECVKVRNWVAHPRAGQLLRDLSQAELLSEGVQFFAEAINPLLEHLRNGNVYPIVVAPRKIEIDAFGRKRIQALNDAGRDEIIIGHLDVTFGRTYFLASASDTRPWIEPLLIMQNVRLDDEAVGPME